MAEVRVRSFVSGLAELFKLVEEHGFEQVIVHRPDVGELTGVGFIDPKGEHHAIYIDSGDHALWEAMMRKPS